MKLNRWRIGAMATTIGLAAIVLSIKTRVRTMALKNEQPTAIAVPRLAAARTTGIRSQLSRTRVPQ